MALSGDIKSVSLVTLFQILEGENKTGVLTLNSGPIQRRLFLHKGSIIFLVSEDPRDFLGHFLVSKGLITEEDLAEAMSRQSEKQELIGQILSHLTKISESEMKEQVSKKIEESVCQLFLLEDADFTFDETEVDAEEFPEVKPLPLQSVLMEGMTRLDEYKVLKGIFPSEQRTFEVVDEDLPVDLPGRKNLLVILGHLKQGLTIADLCLQFHTYEYVILKFLRVLLEKSYIVEGEISKAQEAEQPAKEAEGLTDSALEQARQAEAAGDLVKAFEYYGHVLKDEPGNQKIREKYVQIQTRLAEIIVADLPKKTVLKIKDGINFNELSISSIEGFILSRINGQWSIAEILAVVPVPETEAMAGLKMLLDQGIVEAK